MARRIWIAGLGIQAPWMVLGGAFTRYEKQTMQRIARLNSDGSAD